jgi:hypothetical protein
VELPVEIFDEITGLTGTPAPANESEYERRLHHRFPIGSRAVVSPIRNGAEGPGTVVVIRDISLGGIGFLNAETMKPGDVFNIQFNTEANRTVRLQCMAQRSESGGCGKTQFIIGATFQALIEPKEVLSNPAPALAPPPLVAPVVPAAVAKEAAIAPNDAAATPAPAKGIFSGVKPSAIFNLYEEAEKPADPPEAAAPVAPLKIQTFKETLLPPEGSTEMPAPPVVEPAAVQPEVAPIQPIAHEAMSVRSTSAHAGRNQEILAEAKARLFNQSQVLQQKIQLLDDLDKQLGQQRAAAAELTRERNELKSQLAQAERLLAEERERSGRQMDVLFNELAALKQAMKILQVKSDADDRAIGDLAASLGGEAVSDEQKLRSRLSPTAV